jgi:hypothetical protein
MGLAASWKRRRRDRFGYLKDRLTWILRLTLTASTIMARSLPLPRPCGNYSGASIDRPLRKPKYPYRAAHCARRQCPLRENRQAASRRLLLRGERSVRLAEEIPDRVKSCCESSATPSNTSFDLQRGASLAICSMIRRWGVVEAPGRL